MYLSDLERPFWILSDWLVASQDFLLKNGSALSVLIPFVFCIKYWDCVRPNHSTVIAYFAVTSIVEICGLLTQYSPKGNLNIYNAYSLVEIHLLGLLYAQYTYLPIIRQFITYSSLLFQPFGLYSYITVGPYNYNTLLYAGGAVLISSYLFLYLIDAVITRKQGINYFMLWFTVGAMVFYPNTQIIYLFGTLIMRHPEHLYALWKAGLMLNISFHLFATGAILSLCQEEK